MSAAPTTTRTHVRDRQVLALLVVILVVATVVRVLGTRFGFPLFLHPDEFAVIDGVIDMAERNSFEPGPEFNLRPDHLEMKINYVLFAGFAAIFQGMSIEAAFAADPVPFYWIARLMTAAFGVATVGLAYLVGARWSRQVGIVAAALFAIFPPFVTHAHFATPDVPLTFSVLLLVYALMRYVRSCSWSTLLVAAFAVAMAVSIKYPGAVGTVTIAATVVAAAIRDRAWLRILTHGAGSAAACVGFLFLITPSLFTNISGVRREVAVQAEGDRLAAPDYGFWGNLGYYVDAFGSSAGVLLSLLVLVGCVAAARSRRLELLPWLAGVPFWFSLSTLPMTWERWALPMWVTPLLLASLGFCFGVEHLHRTRARWVPGTVAAVVGLHLGAGSAASVADLLAPDTRNAGLALARAQGIERDESIFEGYTPFLPGKPHFFFGQVGPGPDGDGYRMETRAGTPARYVVLSEAMYARALGNPSLEEEERIYRWVMETHDEVVTVDSIAAPESSWWEPVAVHRHLGFVASLAGGELTGPRIRIFEVPESLRDVEEPPAGPDR